MANKDQRSKKALVESIFLLQGSNYDEWLDKKHDEVILEGSGAIRSAILNMQKASNTEDEKTNNFNVEMGDN